MTGSKSGGLRVLLLPVCWIKGHDLEEESIIQTRNPARSYIRRCRRCGRYEMGITLGTMTISPTDALRAKEAYERSTAYAKEDFHGTNNKNRLV